MEKGMNGNQSREEVRFLKEGRHKKRMPAGRNQTLIWNESGMMTVEVSVIIPALTMVITGLIFFSLFLLDMGVVKSEIQRAADETAIAWKTDGELSTGAYSLTGLFQRKTAQKIFSNNQELLNKARDRLHRRITARTCLVREMEADVHINGFYVCAGCRLGFRIPIRGIADYLSGDHWTWYCSSRAMLDYVQEDLRLSFVVNRRKKNGE